MNQSYAKIRIIKKIDYNTPILVPSFSSKGFPQVKQLHSYLKGKLTEASLISTYDMYYGYLDPDQIYESDILIVDSGGYERNQDHDISDIYNSLYLAKEWNVNLYDNQVSTVHPVTDILLVNYDYQEAYPLKEQVQLAQIHFEKYPDFASDFLCKPTSNNEFFINVDNLILNINLLSYFDVIGFTEKELGNSIYERASSIYRIRKALTEAGLDTPIHIFGCIDPLSIVLYFLCGADIFDGLSWLRFSFKEGSPTYLNHHAINYGLWDRPDNEVKIIGYLENLEVLSQLKKQLIAFAQSSDWEVLHLESRGIKEIKRILARITYIYE
ncbi:hypothetical protein [Bacillus sp. USDA818B3_A]|uniref:hypothetical protein n=1 Tax=Bacillus sp. USDA818B3_A TaxID=2698834 RepID=UPI001370996E|nr:hypothetical protein [Bacillus sp. USDA818B3_A]